MPPELHRFPYYCKEALIAEWLMQQVNGDDFYTRQAALRKVFLSNEKLAFSIFLSLFLVFVAPQ